MVAPFSFRHSNISDDPRLEALVRPGYAKNMFRRPNVSLLTLASLIPEDIEFEYLDEQFEPIIPSGDFDIVAISTMTVNAYRSYQLAKEFREKGAHVIIGGIHASMVPGEVAQHADTVVVGEGESAWLEFLKDFQNGCPNKLYQGGNINLDDSPPPRYDFLPNEAFYSPFFQKEVFTYQYTRGCPHKCTFCASSKVYGKAYRVKSIDKYIQEIGLGLQRSDNHLHFFADDNIFVNPKQSFELLEELKKLRTVWFGSSDLAVAKNNKLLKGIRESGCYCLLIGFESLSSENLRRVDPFKARMLNEYDEYVKRIHDQGINIAASFIVGFDHDHSSSFENIYEFVSRHKIFFSSTSILTPFPSTAVYDYLLQEDRLKDGEIWDKCSGMNLLFKPKKLTNDEMMDGFFKLMKNEMNRSAPDRNFFTPENFILFHKIFFIKFWAPCQF